MTSLSLRQLQAAWWSARSALFGAPGRTAYLVAIVAVTVAACLILAAMSSRFLRDNSAAAANMVSVANARGANAHFLPLRYARKLAAVEGVTSVSYLDLLLASCKGGKTVTLNAIGGSGAASAVAQYGFSEQVVDSWLADPRGVLIGPAAAAECGWRVGSIVSPINLIRQQPLQLHITALAASAAGMTGLAYMHYDYGNRQGGLVGEDQVMSFGVTASDPDQLNQLAARIQDAFAAADPPVIAHPDTVTENAWARFGEVQNLLGMIMAALFLCCALVLVSVLAHAAADRRPHLALQRVLGFPRFILWLGFAVECLLVLALGGLLGLVLGHALLSYLPEVLGQLFGSLALPDWVPWLVLAALLMLGALALIAPTRMVLRVRPVDCQER